MPERPELLIVGGGPAGVSAALWARSLDLRAVLVDDRDSIGGTLHQLYFAPGDLTGVRGVEGARLAATLAQQLEESRIPSRLGLRIARLGPAAAGGPGVAVVTSTGERIEADALLVATGTRRKLLDVPGEREFANRGVSYSANGDRDALRGRTVAVVGGGDAAFSNALILAGLGCDVTLIARGEPRARQEFRDRVATAGTIRVVPHTRVAAIEGGEHVEGLALDGPGGITRLAVEAIVIKAGVVPNSEWLGAAVARDSAGYVLVDARHRTSLARVWAAGDIVRPALLSIAVAAGGAALAVADVRAELKGAAGK